MFKQPRHDELYHFLEWRRQTRFLRRYGGPIMALTLFAACLWTVWRAGHSRKTAKSSAPAEMRARTEQNRSKDFDRFLHATKMPRW